MEKLDEGFFDQYTDDFADYFENQRVMRIMLGSEYKKINKAIREIKNKYPNVVTLLEDGGDDYCRVGGKKEDIEWLDRKEKNKKITELENILKPILDLNIPINTLINEFERLNELEDNMEISKLKSKDKKV